MYDHALIMVIYRLEIVVGLELGVGVLGMGSLEVEVIKKVLKRLFFFCKLLGMVHTRGKSSQDGLRDVWTSRTTLASAYVLCCLSAVWSQFQIIGRSLRWK